jgi:predicted nicotinamide N-methyase
VIYRSGAPLSCAIGSKETDLPKLRHETLVYGDISLNLCMLADRQQFSDDAGEADKLGISSAQWPLFGVVWDAGNSLARHLVDVDVTGKRILEVGCGIAVASLLLNRRGANITAMDYHPEVRHFLDRNIELNGDRPIPFVQGSWNDDLPELGEFDLIIGSDLLYEQEHAAQLADFVLRKLASGGRIIIADPGRGYRGRFTRHLEAAGLTCQIKTVEKVQLLTYERPAI